MKFLPKVIRRHAGFVLPIFMLLCTGVSAAEHDDASDCALVGRITGHTITFDYNTFLKNIPTPSAPLIEGQVSYKEIDYPSNTVVHLRKQGCILEVPSSPGTDAPNGNVHVKFAVDGVLQNNGYVKSVFSLPAGIDKLVLYSDCKCGEVKISGALNVAREEDRKKGNRTVAEFDHAQAVEIEWYPKAGGIDYMLMVINVMGGLFIFLLGMKNMSEGMQAIAGSRLRKMISLATENRFAACGTGALVTSLIQSSSVTTVMAVGFVNAGVMTLLQAIGVILGADIGTTITGWIVSLNVAQYGLPILSVAGFVFLFSKNERLRYSAMMLMGVGMIFFGLAMMKHGLEPMSHSTEFIAWFSKFEPNGYAGVIKCVFVGAFVTAIVQSSSATVAITITLAATNVVSFNTAVALVLGQNIGTTITAYLASLGAATNAKRVAYAHIIIKVVAVIVIVIFFFPYLKLLEHILDDSFDVKKRIAFSHTLFNIILVCMFLPLRGLLAASLVRLIPDKKHKEPPRLTFLDIRLLDTPAFGIQQSADELLNMSDGVRKMLDWVRTAFESEERDDERDKHVFHREEVLDIMQKEIVEFLGNLLTGSVPHDVMDEARKQLRIADEYESISDYIVTILKLNLKIRNFNIKLSADGRRDILDVHDKVTEYVLMINDAVKENNADILSKTVAQGDIITRTIKAYRASHLVRIEKKHTPPINSLVFVDILQSYRKIKEHALNIAEAVAGIK